MLTAGIRQPCNSTLECMYWSSTLQCNGGYCTCPVNGYYSNLLRECVASIWEEIFSITLRFCIICATLFILIAILYLMFSHSFMNKCRRQRRTTTDHNADCSTCNQRQLAHDKPPSYEDIESPPPTYQEAVVEPQEANVTPDGYRTTSTA